MDILNLTKEDLNFLQNKSIEIGVGEIYNDEIKEILICRILQFDIAHNYPYLPSFIYVELFDNLSSHSDIRQELRTIKISIFKVKYIKQISL